MDYILDTDTCFWVLRELEPVVSRVRAQSPADIAVTTMTEAELRYGALKSSDAERNMRRVDALLQAPIEKLPFDSDAARWHAELRLALRQEPIGERGLVIASIARAREAVLVTGNTREFGRVSDLRLEDWREEP